MGSNTPITMRLDLSDPIPIGNWPSGVGLVAFSPDNHALLARQLLNACYENGDGDVEAFEDWWPRIVSDGEYSESLCFPVIHHKSNDLIAFAHCWTSGFIKDIAVRKDWRRRGIARALIVSIAHHFKNAGYSSISLKVQSNNPHGAIAFYRSIGMVEL